MGMSADDLAMLKEGNPEKQQQYQTLLKKVQWQDYVVRLQTRSRSVILSQAPLFDLFMMPAVSIRTGENLTLCLCTRIPVNAPPFPPPPKPITCTPICDALSFIKKNLCRLFFQRLQIAAVYSWLNCLSPSAAESMRVR